MAKTLKTIMGQSQITDYLTVWDSHRKIDLYVLSFNAKSDGIVYKSRFACLNKIGFQKSSIQGFQDFKETNSSFDNKHLLA